MRQIEAGARVVYEGSSMPRFRGEEYVVHGVDDKGRVYLTPVREGLPLIATARPEATLRPATTQEGEAA